MISLPFKILLFVMVDGWNLIARSLLVSFTRREQSVESLIIELAREAPLVVLR